MNPEAPRPPRAYRMLQRFLRFAASPEGRWPANFRDFSAAVLRMATLAPGGRIDTATVDEELERLRSSWDAREPRAAAAPTDDLASVLSAEQLAELDRFDRVQLAEVVRVCRTAASLSAAGRALFDRSRLSKSSSNDADRLRKYLARFELSFDKLRT